MIAKDSFFKIKDSVSSSKYIFKVDDYDVEGYTIIDGDELCDEDYIMFKSINQMYKFQKDNDIEEYRPYLYNCKECGYKTDKKSSYGYHRETNYCRELRGLKPLPKSEKSLQVTKTNSYHCVCCNYTPKTKTNRNLMLTHTRSKKHVTKCKEAGVSIKDCLTPVGK